MATVLKVTRLSNPRRGAGPRRAVRRRKMTPLQKLYFGSGRQRAHALRRTKRKLHSGAFRARRVSIKVNRRRARRSFNPALVATLGAMNPRKRRTNVARTRKRKSNARRVYRRRRTSRAMNPYRRRKRNATRIVVVAPRRRRRNARRVHSRRRVHNRRRRSLNPFPTLGGGRIMSSAGLQMIGGGLIGVAAAKFIPTLLPSSISGALGGGTLMRVVITGASAVAAGYLAGKVNSRFGEGVLFGGLMQTGSVALNAFLPGFNIAGVPLGLSGMGELMPGSYVVPQNPIRAAIPPPAPANPRMTVNGLARAYGAAF